MGRLYLHWLALGRHVEPGWALPRPKGILWLGADI